MTIIEVLKKMAAIMMWNCEVVITYGGYVGTHKVALQGTVRELLDIIHYYPNLASGTLDPNGVIHRDGGYLELFNCLYKGENAPRQKFIIEENGVKATYETYDVCVRHAKGVIAETFGLCRDDLVPVTIVGDTETQFVRADILFDN